MENDEKELREWMEENIGGIREDRSAAGYALEFLKTAKANTELRDADWLADGLLERVEAIRSKVNRAANILDDIGLELPR